MTEAFDFAIDDFFSDLESEVPVVPEAFQSGEITVKLDDQTHVIRKESVAYEPGTELLHVYSQFDQHVATMAEGEALLESVKAEVDKLREDYNAKLTVLMERRHEIDASLTVARAEKRRLEKEVAEAQQRLRVALESEKLRADFLENSARFDQITAGAPWREYAFPHQLEGAKLIASADGRAILADKMGLGKTLTSLIVADMLQLKKILIIVPDDIVGNFYREVKHWVPGRTAFFVGKMPKRQRNLLLDMALEDLDEFTIIVNYSAWRKDNNLIERLIGLHFDMVICDEAHTIKEVTTNAYRGVHKIVLAENSCPECRGNIQKVHISADQHDMLAHDEDYAKRSFGVSHRDYWVCVGNHPATDGAVPEEHVRNIGCGWSQMKDVVFGVKRAPGYLRSVTSVIPMTGTPILNKPTDLYAQLSLIWPEKFNDKYMFERMYCEKQNNRVVFKPGGLKRLTAQIAGRYIMRDRRTAGVILPKQDIVVHSIELDEKLYPKQTKVIKDLTYHAMLALEDGAVKSPVLYTISLILRKRQANVYPAGIQLKDGNGLVVFNVGDEVRESVKLDRLLTPADSTESGDPEGLVYDFTAGGDLTNGDRVVIFSQFKEPLKELEARIAEAGISVVRLDGDTPQDVRTQIQLDFDRKYCEQDGYEVKWQVVLCNYKTGGQGLNFTSATQMVFLDEEWNPGKEDQAAGRMDRMGQTEESTVHILRIENTIDDWMSDLIDSKRSMIEGFHSNIDLATSLLNAMRKGEMM